MTDENEVSPVCCANCGIELNIDEQYEVECWQCRIRDRSEDTSQVLTEIAMRYHYAQTQSN
jgi:hypothetical protein